MHSYRHPPAHSRAFPHGKRSGSCSAPRAPVPPARAQAALPGAGGGGGAGSSRQLPPQCPGPPETAPGVRGAGGGQATPHLRSCHPAAATQPTVNSRGPTATHRRARPAPARSRCPARRSRSNRRSGRVPRSRPRCRRSCWSPRGARGSGGAGPGGGGRRGCASCASCGGRLHDGAERAAPHGIVGTAPSCSRGGAAQAGNRNAAHAPCAWG